MFQLGEHDSNSLGAEGGRGRRLRKMPLLSITAVPQQGKAESAARCCWHVITSEYPPQLGGVADYTSMVAAGLAAQGDEVHVWCPPSPGTPAQPDGVIVHRELGAMGPRALNFVGKRLDQFPEPRRILVQWVPHGFGYRSMNLPFCWWLRRRTKKHGDRVEIMAHEPFLPFNKHSLRQSGVALVHRLMTLVLLRTVDLVWMSIPGWENYLRPYALGRSIAFRWIPIPGTIPLADNPALVRAIRQRHTDGQAVLIGHFGTYGESVTSILEPVLVALADHPNRQNVLLVGKGSEAYRQALVGRHPKLARVVQAAGTLTAESLSCHLLACDLLFQPYPDGVSTRRTSCIVALSHGKAVVTNMGGLSESFWKDTGALVLAPAADTDTFLHLLGQVGGDEQYRVQLGRTARKLYQDRFDISHTVEALRAPANRSGHSPCES